ncbi:MAG: TIGR02710 family CRISPR-associated protein, partial [Bacilli bacterium]|nr:TIGR02710 family CRISPR-associated protein [Bacilli bacterium]
LEQDYHIAPMESIDDFNACFEIFEREIWKYDFIDDDIDYRIIMDYTSGTKTMSAAMACCGMFYSKDLISVGGDRTTGEVSSGTELINYQNLYKIYDKFALMRTRDCFNSYQFVHCINILNYIIDMNIHKDSFLNLCKSYYAWDNMEFEHAYEHMTKVDFNNFEFVEIKDVLEKNMKALGTIVHARSANLKNCYILATLINNSIRKAEEYKYDDAIARLYRSFELIAQIQLTKYNIESSDVNVSILLENGVSQDFVNELENTKEDGKIRIGLIKDYSLLYELNDELGKYYIDNVNLIKNLTRKRNNSILAHGLDSQSKEDFDEFLEIVLDLARKIDKHMNRFLNETKFAKFNIRLSINR